MRLISAFTIDTDKAPGARPADDFSNITVPLGLVDTAGIVATRQPD